VCSHPLANAAMTGVTEAAAAPQPKRKKGEEHHEAIEPSGSRPQTSVETLMGENAHLPVCHGMRQLLTACSNCVDDLGRDVFLNVPLGCGTLVCRHRETNPFAVLRGRARQQPDAVPFRSSVRFLELIEHQKHGEKPGNPGAKLETRNAESYLLFAHPNNYDVQRSRRWTAR
jgi:hypothetical protein